jgi:hypothetical protein
LLERDAYPLEVGALLVGANAYPLEENAYPLEMGALLVGGNANSDGDSPMRASP